ncbi:hypothetical protein [Paenibacillus tianjinensis]|uniref:Uncharacterized protein n=1 Tax=Paenibacillus tianjinensis TaxID=2810347 RepID=A0ABX7L5W7_9BACL|nr:hypothetical protein [Paenibacillus tianjinensis]QSF42641.1 hypothetical protein JRJ22_15090 [Paenibacillus tianjinensis]
MNSTDVTNIKELLPLADRYGLAYIVALVLLFIVIYFLRAISRGDLVPRELLDRAEEDRDRLQAILDKERADFMAPTLEVLQRLKIDHAASSGNDEDRGG